MDIKDFYDFSCWVIKYDAISIKGKTYQKDSLKSNDGMLVPLLWNHEHTNPTSVLGQALLEHREDGVYAYCKLYDIPIRKEVEKLILDGSLVSLSPMVRLVKQDDKTIIQGKIAEVSLVYFRINPDESYRPVMRGVK